MFSICFCSTANSYRFRSCSPIIIPVRILRLGAVVGSHGEIVHGAFVNFAAQRFELCHVDGVGVFSAGGEVGDLAGAVISAHGHGAENGFIRSEQFVFLAFGSV